MTESPGSHNTPEVVIGSPRSSTQSVINLIPKLYKDGASVIFEYSEGLICYDCHWIKINSYGREGSVSFLPHTSAILEWTNNSEFDFKVAIGAITDIKEETEFFKETMGSVYFKFELIKSRKLMKLDNATIGTYIAETYYANM